MEGSDFFTFLHGCTLNVCIMQILAIIATTGARATCVVAATAAPGEM